MLQHQQQPNRRAVVNKMIFLFDLLTVVRKKDGCLNEGVPVYPDGS
jgi:hypothetical protein